MKKVFIDCGANDGCSVRKFRRIQPDAYEYEVHCFEANPVFSKHFENLGVSYHEKAVWVENKQLVFYQIENRSKGKESGASTLNQAKAYNHKNVKLHPMRVQGIDFSKWVLDNFSKDDYIILKMDIEGSEYEVLSKMMKDGSFAYIDKLLIEFHWYKCAIDKSVHDRIVSQINIPMEEWDAMGE